MNVTIIRNLSIIAGGAVEGHREGPADIQSASRAPTEGVLAVIMDWAGTTIDHLSSAPAKVFVEVFKRQGIEVTEAQARGPMGTAKRDHIATVIELPPVKKQWTERHSRAPQDSDIDTIYHTFLPLQKEILSDYSTLIPGALESFSFFRQRGIKMGSTTGYTKDLMSVVVPLAKAQGYDPASTVCSDEVKGGRPAPWQIYQAAQQLGVYPMSRVVKIDDTTVGIVAGRNAGCWTVAVTGTGNEMAIAQLNSPRSAREQLLKTIEQKFNKFGAHYCVDSIANIAPIIDQINARIARGECP
jgi:phosphonoacetaldehyde hydrolase